jgi:hypothetical protein
VVQVVQEVAKCTSCGKEGSENPKDHFQKAAVPTPVLPHSVDSQIKPEKFLSLK